MIEGKVSCLMATYGRHARVCEALACFLSQDYADRELVILNNHPEPLIFDCYDGVNDPNVRTAEDAVALKRTVKVINEPGHATLGHCRNRLLDFADGEFMRLWDDDDLYLPWAISQGVARIGNAAAWKPEKSLWCNGPNQIGVAANAMEASITWRTHFVRQFGFHLGEGDESKTLLAALGNAGPATGDVGQWASYLYRWGCGEWHASGTIGNGDSDEQRAADWKANNNDVKPGTPLAPAYGRVQEWWRKIVRLIEPGLQSRWMAAALGVGPAHVKPVTAASKETNVHFGAVVSGSRRLVVAPGCWDVLHPGHIDTLRWARTQGDWLIVLVNDDQGVAEQKGEHRPLVPLAGRIAALSDMECVDGIIVVPGKDDMPLLRQLKPAVLVKGPDYAWRAQAVPRHDGCEVRIAPNSSFARHTSSLSEAA